MSNRKKPTIAKNEEDPVDQLLQTAQDELLLKLSVDSHMSRVFSDYLLPDLDRRLQALRSRPTTTIQSSTIVSKSQPSKSQDDVGPDDLFARFAALKASNNTTSSSTLSGPSGFDQGGGDDEEEEDEVEKIIRWAKDSARLDPSPPSDEDEDEDDHDDSDEDDVDNKVGNVPVKVHRK